VQDVIDLNHDGVADDLDRDGNSDKLWTLTMATFNKIADVSTVSRWKQARVLATNCYVRKLVASGTLTGPNISTFQFSAHNPLAMLFDTAAYGGNADDNVSESELGNMISADGIINSANEVASIDSITITLNVVEQTHEGSGRTIVLSGDISSDLITPRSLTLLKRNGIVSLPDPTLASNIQ
jgi:hypothetical protein